jgi:hypothetical protein
MDAKGLAVPPHVSSVLRMVPGCWATKPAGSIMLFEETAPAGTDFPLRTILEGMIR